MCFVIVFVLAIYHSSTINNTVYNHQLVLILKEALFSINNVKFFSISLSASCGGAIYIDQIHDFATISINRTFFYQCSAMSGGAIYSSSSKLVIGASCCSKCNSELGQDIYFAKNEGSFSFDQVLCCDHGIAPDEKSILLFSLSSNNGMIKDSNLSSFESSKSGFFCTSSNGYCFVYFTNINKLYSHDSHSFFFSFTDVKIECTNFIDCNSKGIKQFLFISSKSILKSCIIIQCPNLSFGFLCIGCFFDNDKENGCNYSNCTFLTIAPLNIVTNLGCNRFDYDCSTLSSQFVSSTIKYNNYYSCFLIEKCVFYGIHSESNGGCINFVSPFISLNVISSVFSNSSSCNQKEALNGGAIYFFSLNGHFSMSNSCGFYCYSDSSHMACIILDEKSCITINRSTISSCSPQNNFIGSSLEISGSSVTINSTRNSPSDYSAILSLANLGIDYSLIINNTAKNGVIIYSPSCVASNTIIKDNECKLCILKCQQIIASSCWVLFNNANSTINAASGYIINSILDRELTEPHISKQNITYIKYDSSLSPALVFNAEICLLKPVYSSSSSGYYDKKSFLYVGLLVVILILAIMTIRFWRKNQAFEETSLIQRSVLFDFG